jgi:glycosyltransferase involved in cell wall biosynthesis
MNKPKVSIIIPVYNVEPYVEECIKSVMQQTYKGTIECIVVDDCGTDQSIATVEKTIAGYRGVISFTILHHDCNRGLSAARNTGMDAAKGDYIFFLDSDDKLTNDCVEKLAEPLKTEWYDVVSGKVEYILGRAPLESVVINGLAKKGKMDDVLLTSPMILKTYRKLWRWEAWNKLYRLSFLREYQLRFKEGIIFEDVPWTFEIACLATSFYIVSNVTYIYRKRNGSIMNLITEQDYVRYYPVLIQETSSFVDKYKIETSYMGAFFDVLFSKVLRYVSSSRFRYVSTYKSLRPFIKASLGYFIKKHRFHVKRYLRDLHYLMPLSVAPYWQYYIYVFLIPRIKNRISRNNRIKIVL